MFKYNFIFPDSKIIIREANYYYKIGLGSKLSVCYREINNTWVYFDGLLCCSYCKKYIVVEMCGDDYWIEPVGDK